PAGGQRVGYIKDVARSTLMAATLLAILGVLGPIPGAVGQVVGGRARSARAEPPRTGTRRVAVVDAVHERAAGERASQALTRAISATPGIDLLGSGPWTPALLGPVAPAVAADTVAIDAHLQAADDAM